MPKLKRADLITTLLLLFLFSIPIIVFVVITINNNVQHFTKQSETITRLKLLDKDFNYFVAQKGTFVNYDLINDKIENFKKELLSLKDIMMQSKNRSLYIKLINQIENDYKLKSHLLEHSKSYNSIIINSLNYLHDLQKNIKITSSLTESDLTMLDNTIFMTIQLFTSINQNKEIIDENLAKIKKLSKLKNNELLAYFYQHEKSILDKIVTLEQEKISVENLHIFDKLNTLHTRLQNDFQSYLMLGKLLMVLILFFITSLLLSILYLHRNSLKHKKQLAAYKYAIENSDNSIIITDIDKNIVYANDAFVKETGYDKSEIMGENPRILQSGLMSKEYYAPLNSALDNYEKWEGEFINKRKDGTIFYEKASISPLIMDGKVTGYLAVKLNITKYIEQEKKVKFLAYHDPLTSLPNRVKFENYFQQEVLDKKKPCALLYIDLDHFKNINDTLGHHTGDALLKVFAQRLKRKVSKKDFVAKIGGDEFVIVIEIKDQNDAIKIAKRVLKSLQNPIEVHGHKLNISASIGIAMFPQDGATLQSLLKYADTAMYKAKTNGRNNFQFFTQDLSREIYKKLKIEQELREALKKDELYVVYQPKYNLKTLKTVGFEALVRWENKKLGFVPPDQFISVAEDIGLINEIGYFIFKKACRDFRIFKEIDPSLEHVAVNVSILQFKENEFTEKINQICKDENLKPSNIEIEITESCVMENVEKNIEHMKELRKFGYKIAIDDFGTGYSSFSYLKRLPATTLKIDKSFVDDICTNSRDKDIAGAIIALAQNLDFTTVAEGIEYKEQEVLLEKMGCISGQGFYYSKPHKFDDLKNFIQNGLDQKVSAI